MSESQKLNGQQPQCRPQVQRNFWSFLDNTNLPQGTSALVSIVVQPIDAEACGDGRNSISKSSNCNTEGSGVLCPCCGCDLSKYFETRVECPSHGTITSNRRDSNGKEAINSCISCNQSNGSRYTNTSQDQQTEQRRTSANSSKHTQITIKGNSQTCQDSVSQSCQQGNSQISQPKAGNFSQSSQPGNSQISQQQAGCFNQSSQQQCNSQTSQLQTSSFHPSCQQGNSQTSQAQTGSFLQPSQQGNSQTSQAQTGSCLQPSQHGNSQTSQAQPGSFHQSSQLGSCQTCQLQAGSFHPSCQQGSSQTTPLPSCSFNPTGSQLQTSSFHPSYQQGCSQTSQQQAGSLHPSCQQGNSQMSQLQSCSFIPAGEVESCHEPSAQFNSTEYPVCNEPIQNIPALSSSRIYMQDIRVVQNMKECWERFLQLKIQVVNNTTSPNFERKYSNHEGSQRRLSNKGVQTSDTNNVCACKAPSSIKPLGSHQNCSAKFVPQQPSVKSYSPKHSFEGTQMSSHEERSIDRVKTTSQEEPSRVSSSSEEKVQQWIEKHSSTGSARTAQSGTQTKLAADGSNKNNGQTEGASMIELATDFDLVSCGASVVAEMEQSRKTSAGKQSTLGAASSERKNSNPDKKRTPEEGKANNGQNKDIFLLPQDSLNFEVYEC